MPTWVVLRLDSPDRQEAVGCVSGASEFLARMAAYHRWLKCPSHRLRLVPVAPEARAEIVSRLEHVDLFAESQEIDAIFSS